MRTAAVTTTMMGGFGVVLWLHTADDPSSADWQRGIDLALAARARHGLPGLRQLVISDGGAPNIAQRKQLTEVVFQNQPGLLAVIASVFDNPVKRGIATALSWVNPRFKPVPTERWREAFAHVELTGHIARVLDEFRKLQEELPPVAVLDRVVREAG